MKTGRITTAAGSFLTLFALTLLPWGEFKINRVARGIPIQAMGFLGWAMWTASIVVLLFIIALIRWKPRLFNAVLSWVFLLLPSFALILLSRFIPDGVDFDPKVARISLGIGFYLFYVGILLLLSKAKYPKLKIFLSFLFILVFSGNMDALGLVREYRNIEETFLRELSRHLTLALFSAMAAILPGILLGYAAMRYPKAREWVFGFVHVFQVAPTLSLLALMMIPLTALSKAFPFLADLGIKGIGFAPAFIVLFLYSLLPITANTYAGLKQTDPAVLENAVALGMSPRQTLIKVWFPLTLPSIFAGIRTAMTQNVGNTILAGLVGGGGMGALIFLGLSQSALDLVLLGTIPVVVMALILDTVFEVIELATVRKLGVDYDRNLRLE